MSAAAEITTAIEFLTNEHATQSVAYLLAHDYYGTGRGLPATLHRTIEPQLAILRDFLAEVVESNKILTGELISDDFAGTRNESTMALVHAINGGAA